MSDRRAQRWIILLSGLAFSLAMPVWTEAGPIHSDVALTPRKGGSILRLQYTYSDLDGLGDVQHVNTSSVRATYVYGVKENLALFWSLPYVNRQVDRVVPKQGRIEDAHDGIGDLTFLAKYRFWQRDSGPLHTARWAVLGGVTIRTGDSDFTSDSYDPIVGTVFTWRRDQNHFDADLIYRFGTGRSKFRHDTLRYDLAYSFRLFPRRFDLKNPYALDAVAELNGRFTTDGSHEVFLSPGLQWAMERWVLEASVQLPIIQEFGSDVPETDFRLVVGIRFQW